VCVGFTVRVNPNHPVGLAGYVIYTYKDRVKPIYGRRTVGSSAAARTNSGKRLLFCGEEVALYIYIYTYIYIYIYTHSHVGDGARAFSSCKKISVNSTYMRTYSMRSTHARIYIYIYVHIYIKTHIYMVETYRGVLGSSEAEFGSLIA